MRYIGEVAPLNVWYTAGEQYSVGREIFCWDDDNSSRDTIVMLEVLIDSAGDKKTSPRMIFPWILAEDNPVISG